MATEDDVYDVVLASSSYLYAFGEFSRRRNRRTRPRRFWVHNVLRRRDDLGEYARLVQELRLDSDMFHRYFRMSTEQFVYVLGWWDHTFHVYQLTTDSRYTAAQRHAITLRLTIKRFSAVNG